MPTPLRRVEVSKAASRLSFAKVRIHTHCQPHGDSTPPQQQGRHPSQHVSRLLRRRTPARVRATRHNTASTRIRPVGDTNRCMEFHETPPEDRQRAVPSLSVVVPAYNESENIHTTTTRIREVLDEHQVSLTSAALQFPLRHPAVKSVLVGCRSAAEVESNIEEFDKTIENRAWDDLESVL